MSAAVPNQSLPLALAASFRPYDFEVAVARMVVVGFVLEGSEELALATKCKGFAKARAASGKVRKIERMAILTDQQGLSVLCQTLAVQEAEQTALDIAMSNMYGP